MKRLDIVRWTGRCFMSGSPATPCHPQEITHALPQDVSPRHVGIDCPVTGLRQRKSHAAVDLTPCDVLHVQGAKDCGMKFLWPIDILCWHPVCARAVNFLQNLLQIA